MRYLAIVTLGLLLTTALARPLPAAPGGDTLYARLGGVYAIADVVDAFLDRLLKDPVIAANPRTVEAMGNVTVAGLKYEITSFVCHAAGGPQTYSGRSMQASHAHLKISEAEWQACLKDMEITLKEFGVPEKESAEVMALLASLREQIVAKP